MQPLEPARAATARCGSDPRNCHELASRDSSDHNPSLQNLQRQRATARDARLLSLDYLAELGDDLVTAGAALAAGASADNVGVVERALRSARAVLMDAIGEFKSLPGEDGGAL